MALQDREQAYRGLVCRYQGRVYKLIYRMVRRDRELAKDLTQDDLVKLQRGRERAARVRTPR